MLEVGNLEGPNADIETRSHFGAWCITSSPLMLGFDMTNKSKMDTVWDTISNWEAIEVWRTPDVSRSQAVFHKGRTLLCTSGILTVVGTPSGSHHESCCRCVCVGQVNQAWAGHPGFLSKGPGTAFSPQEVWSKPMSGGRIAVLMINQGNTTATVTIDAHSLHANGSAMYKIRDVWKHVDAGTTPPPHAVEKEKRDSTRSASTPHAGDLLSLAPCRQPSTPSQSWRWLPTTGHNSTVGRIELAVGGLCVAVSNVSDPDTHLPSAEMRMCIAADSAQNFHYDEITFRMTHVPSGSCLVRDALVG